MSDICIIGGCGHVGIPLGLSFANAKENVVLLDINQKNIDLINTGKLPYQEIGAEDILLRCIGKNLFATADKNVVKNADVVVFVVGTPASQKNKTSLNAFLSAIEEYVLYINKKQLIILRSSVFPGASKEVCKILNSDNVAFCPERIVQGNGIEEIRKLPQIISAFSPKAMSGVENLFKKIAPSVVKMEVEEAELAKLITNSWRYIEFAIANQFYQLLENKGFDFYKIFDAIKYDYPRAKNFCGAGLAKGPCLYKDTLQMLAYFNEQEFSLGNCAIKTNEGLPKFLVQKLENKIGNLEGKTIAVLGKTFKADSDDVRDSASLDIADNLTKKGAKVVFDDAVLGIKADLNKVHGAVLATPHSQYKNIKLNDPIIDCWNIHKGNKK